MLFSRRVRQWSRCDGFPHYVTIALLASKEGRESVRWKNESEFFVCRCCWCIAFISTSASTAILTVLKEIVIARAIRFACSWCLRRMSKKWVELLLGPPFFPADCIRLLEGVSLGLLTYKHVQTHTLRWLAYEVHHDHRWCGMINRVVKEVGSIAIWTLKFAALSWQIFTVQNYLCKNFLEE